MLVSFIIPAYNAADTIVRCLDSIYALTLNQSEFEVIVIDDCSTDNTCEIVENYTIKREARHHSSINNLILLTQPKNNRQGAARNRGVSVAQGEYICFVDSDDAVTEGIIDAILLAKKNNLDMTAFHYVKKDFNSKINWESKRLDFKENEVMTGILFEKKFPYWCSGPVPYVYNADFLRSSNYPFMEGVLYEDADFVMRHLYHAQRMGYSTQCGYVVYEVAGSTTRKLTYRNLADFLFLGMRMLALYDDIRKDVKRNQDPRGVSELELANSFAEDVLDGACYNLYYVFAKLHRLESWGEVKNFYAKIDGEINRDKIANNEKLRTHYWNAWTSLCLKHRRLAMVVCAVKRWGYKLLKWVKRK